MLCAVMGIGIVAWYLARERSRQAERLVLLQFAREHHPDAPARMLAHLDRHPDDAEVLEALVEWQLWARNPAAEIEPRLDRLCTLAPDNLNAFRVRARLRVQNGRPAEGLADALHVVERDPADNNTRLLAAIAASEAGQPETAIRELTQLLENSPLQRDDLATRLVDAHLQAGDPIQAEVTLKRFLNTTTGEAQLLRGRVYQAAGRHAEAIPLFRAVADKSPKERETALYSLAESQRALGREGDLARTLEELDRVKTRDRIVKDARQQPDSLAAQIRAAEVLIEDGQPAEAVAMLEQTMLRLGKSPTAGKVLARAYRQIGRTDLALEWERFSSRP